MRSFTLLALSACAAGLAQAHVELLFPPPINSKYDPQTIESDKDYSMTSPLNADGSNFPCKGYNTPDKYSTLSPVATLKAGSTFEIEFAAGGATHQGGSCQFSVSYDQGKTFAVIHSVMGGCPLWSTYDVPIPSDLPSAKSATFAWTWQNKVGNREFYMNCAIVDIEGGSSKSYTGPGLYRANSFADGTCIIPEGTEVVFPNPGPSPAYGSSITSSTPATTLSDCPYDEDTTVTISPSGSSSSGSSGSSNSETSSSSAATASSPTTTTTQASVVVPTTSAAPVTTTTTTSRRARPDWRSRSSSAAATSQTTTTSSSSKASATKTQWYAAPTASASGAGANLHVSASSTSSAETQALPSASPSSSSSSSSSSTGSSSPSSSNDDGSGTWISCTSSTTWSLCSSSTGCTPMGLVAAGTECRNGAIGLAQRRMVRVKRGTAGAARATRGHLDLREVEKRGRRGVRDHVARAAARSH
ncbi:hypothetical protein JCM11251_003465 [Rhodosporidiobolus azoricus]